MAIHSSILAWEIPRTEEPGGLQTTGSQELDTTEQLIHTHTYTHTHVHTHTHTHMCIYQTNAQLVGAGGCSLL